MKFILFIFLLSFNSIFSQKAEHVHNIPKSKFGIGAGYERIFDTHGHNTVGLVGSFRPLENWDVIAAPGLTWEDVNSKVFNPSLHLETAYEFEFKNFHIGPAFEFAIEPEDYHISFGLHIGYGF
jgi:hypothetical protein